MRMSTVGRTPDSCVFRNLEPQPWSRKLDDRGNGFGTNPGCRVGHGFWTARGCPGCWRARVQAALVLAHWLPLVRGAGCLGIPKNKTWDFVVARSRIAAARPQLISAEIQGTRGRGAMQQSSNESLG